MNTPATASHILIGLAGCGRIAFDTQPDASAEQPSARSHLVLEQNLPTTQLADFPLPIVLDSTRADLALLTPATFRAFAGSTELHVEVETVNGEDPFVAWVRVPIIEPTPIEITIEYGGATSELHDVWDSSYLLVLHANGDAIDSSTYARGSATTNVSAIAGRLGGGAGYDPALQSCVVVPSFSGLTFPSLTLSAWIRTRVPPPMFGYYVAITRQLADTAVDDFILGIDPADVALGGVATGGGGSPSRMGTSVLPAGAWHLLAYTYESTAQSSGLWANGVGESIGFAMGVPVTGPRPLMVGCGRNAAGTAVDVPDGDYVDGDLDEVRVESVGRSDAWLRFDYFAQSDGVITYGPIEHR